MLLKIVVCALLVLVFYALCSGLWFLIQDGAGSERMVKALTWRVAFSLLVFTLILVGVGLGWIDPNVITRVVVQ